MKTTLFLLSFFAPILLQAQIQIDSINTANSKLQMAQLNEGSATYLVYLQDSASGPKYRTEVWDRSIQKKDEYFEFKWNRYAGNGSVYHYQIKVSARDFAPIEERTLEQRRKGKEVEIKRKHFIYKGGKIYTHRDTTRHSESPFELSHLNNSFNWEMDLEMLSMLQIEDGRIFAINFYHPGSKTLPAYYAFEVIRSEVLEFNDATFDCWVLKVVYSDRQSSEFWVDKKTNRVLKMKEFFFGRYRYKVLVI